LKNDIVSVWADISGNCSKGFKKTYMDKKYFIGNGICQLDRASIFGDIKKSSLGIGVKMTEMKFKMPSLNGVMPEALFLQNLPSIAVSRFLNPIYNSRVLDMCASPGGKTCHTAALMNNTGTIFALDKIQKKTIAIQQNCDRLGIENVQVITSDSSMLIENGIFEAESFDYIILDPPCSGLGLRPNLKISVSEFDNATSFAPYQRKLFQQAWALLKPGGRMSYSTCTLNPLENEVLVEKMLNIFKNSKLAPIRSGILEKYCLPGLVTGSLSQEICETSICRFYPSAEHDTIGFFFVIFEKTANKID
jgi:methyltransferase NSUN6